MINAIIFDLDGLLADTEKLHLAAYKKVFSKLGYELLDEDYADHWIRNVVRRDKAHIYKELVSSSVRPMPGARELLFSLQGRKLMALATSSHPKDAHAVVKTLDFVNFFSYIAAKNSVERVKPYPDIFLHVAEEISTSPENCLVLEDAEKGILAADAAGMKSIAVPNTHTKNNDFSKATLVVKSLEEVNCELIDQL